MNAHRSWDSEGTVTGLLLIALVASDSLIRLYVASGSIPLFDAGIVALATVLVVVAGGSLVNDYRR